MGEAGIISNNEDQVSDKEQSGDAEHAGKEDHAGNEDQGSHDKEQSAKEEQTNAWTYVVEQMRNLDRKLSQCDLALDAAEKYGLMGTRDKWGWERQ